MAEKTATFAGGSVTLYSRWQCQYGPDPKTKVIGYYFYQGPSVGEGTASITYSLPSGAKITSATLTASYGRPLSGISYVMMNGGVFKGSEGVALSGNSGTFSARFQFKAIGTKDDTSQHVSTLSISGITLTIVYDDEQEEDEKEKEEQLNNEVAGEFQFRIPPQDVCIFDQEESKVYTFDGVLKIQQSMTLKIEEDPSKKKELYVNNARNEPDKVTLDVMMSDVYSGTSTLTVHTGSDATQQAAMSAFDGTQESTRSGRAVAVLHMLKEARRMLTVITPQYVYTDMLLQGVTISQDDATPFGWEGQLTFQEKYETTQQKDNTSSKASNSNVEKRTPS